MPSVTIKKFPEPLLARLKKKAALARRSLTQEMLARLEASLHGSPISPPLSYAEPEQQAEAWAALSGKWKSGLTVQEEITSLFKARTRGRKVEL